ncbi:MAG: class I SAM-dependent RNA methyltransferase [Mollicutes bacterium]|nr:class I SAM-dependent RNA methyltransferase [Mollicutes bacterium]
MKNIIEIKKLDHQGRGIGYINNIITFIPNALVEEQVEVKLTKQSKKYNEGEIISIVKKSNKRIIPECRFYPQCGGCQLQHLSYEDELIYKENKIKEIMNKYASLDEKLIKKIIPNPDLNYRNKVVFHIDNEIGYYQEKTNQLIPIDHCLIADNKINHILNELKKMDLSMINKAMIRVGKNDSLIVFYTDKEPVISDGLSSLVNNILLFDGENHIVQGKDYLIEEIGNYKYKVSPESFFQVNTKGAERLYDLVLNYVKGSNKVLDLYCGVGSIGIYISSVVEEVVGVEINQSAIEDALINKELNKINNIEFINQDVSNYKIKDNFDTIIIDPPRKGLDQITIEYLLNSEAERIIYIACDPITLSRDLKLLSEVYNVVEVTPVDLFSRTYHLECICLLNKIK